MGSYLFGRKTSVRSSGRRSSHRSGHVPDQEVHAFQYGLVNYPEAQEIPRGAASDELNFITRGTKIETRNGYAPYGDEIAGNSKAYVFTAHKWDGTEIIFKASGNSLYYDSDGAGTWVEVGTNILAGNNGETIWFGEYFSPAGAQMWVSSTHTDLIKIMTANPGSYKSQYDSSKNFKGSIQIKTSRMFLWNYLSGSIGKATKNTLQGSCIDAQAYTTVSAEAHGNGDGATKTFAGTLSALTGKRTGFGIQFTDTVESFVDDYMGNLTGTLGGTGTINYSTGAYSITFSTAPVNLAPITATYQWEDSTAGGIADFSRSATRTAGQGFSLPQNEGGDIKTVLSLNGSEYVLHERKAYVVNIPADDTQTTNQIYREKLGLASDQGAVAGAEGIYYIDTTRKPFVGILTYDPVSSLVMPKNLSEGILDLTGYLFDKCVAFEFDVFVGFACRTAESTVNNRILLLNRAISGSGGVYVFDMQDFFAQSFCLKNGALIAGDSATASVFNLFANYDDDGAVPNSYWAGNVDDYGSPGLKKARSWWFEGEIDINQEVAVYLDIDRGGYVQIGTISGAAGYVDKSQSTSVGSLIVGLKEVGDGSNGSNAFHYQCEIRSRISKFQNRKIKFVPLGIGYFSVSRHTDHDIVFHEDKLPARYRTRR